MAVKILNGIDVEGSMNIVASDVPNLDASKITSGTFSTDRIPNLSGIYQPIGNYLTSVPSEYLTQTEGDARYLKLTGGTLTGTLTLSAVNPRIDFNGTSDAGVDMAIVATPEGLNFIEPEQGDKVQFQILDDTGVNSPFGYQWNGQSLDSRYASASHNHNTLYDSIGSADAVQTWVGEQNFATDAAINTAVSNYLPLSGGNITGNTSINGDLDVGAVGKTSDTVVRSLADQSYKAGFEAYGNGQGTGYFYAGQSNSYGGGFSYNGDGSPGFISGETADHITFFRRSADTNTEVFHYAYSSNDVYFNGAVVASGSNSNDWNTAYGWGNHASVGYLTSIPSSYATDAEVNSAVSVVNDRIDTEILPSIPTNNNQLTNGAGYLTTSGKAADSNLLDGIDSSGFVRAYGTSNDNIDADWGQSFKTFDPVPSGTPPIASPNLRTINVGENFARRTQIAFDYATDRAWFRRRHDSTWRDWKEFYHTGNLSLATLGYTGATNANYITNNNQLTNGAGYATTSYVNTAVSNLVASAPAALDTLNELAAALGDDANFSTTVANSIGAIDSRIDTEVLPAIDAKQNAGNYASFSYITLNDSATTASFIAELTTEHGAFQDNYRAYKVGWSYAGNSNLDVGFESVELAGCLIECFGGTYKHVRLTRPTTGTGGRSIYVYNDQGSSYAPGWRQIWTSDEFSSTNVSNWNTAYGWGNHASAGYLTSIPSTYATDAELASVDQGINDRIDTEVLPAIPTNNNQLTNGAGYTTNTGTITGVSTGTGLDGTASSGAVTITLDLSELTDMTAAVSPTADELILLDNGAERKKLFSEIFGSAAYQASSAFDAAGTGAAEAGAVKTWVQEQNYASDAAINTAIATVTLSSLGYTGDTNANYITNNNQLTNGAGYLTTLPSHDHSRIVENAAITYGAGQLQWTDVNGNGGTGLNGAAPGNPFSEWWHHIIMNHANSSGYYVDIAACFHSDDLYFRRNVAGSLSSWKEIIHDGNIGTYADAAGSADAVNSRIENEVLPAIPTNNNQLTNGAGYITSADGGNANLLDGLDLGGTRANVANKVVRTDGNGYTNFGWINTTSGRTTSALTDIYVNTNDGYIRKATPAHFRSQITDGSYDSIGSAAAVDTRIDTEVMPAIPTNNNQLTNGAGYITGYTETSTLDSVADRGRTTNQQLISTNPSGFRVDSGSSARIEIDSNNNWSYLRLMDNGTVCWDIATFDNGSLEWRPGGGDSNRMTLSKTGNLSVNGTIVASDDITAFSDARIKENVETLPNALDKVKSMRGVTYNKIGEEKQSVGVIAQELEEVVPQLVHTDEEGMKSVAYGNITAVLIEALKEQQAQIEELKARLDGLTK